MPLHSSLKLPRAREYTQSARAESFDHNLALRRIDQQQNPRKFRAWRATARVAARPAEGPSFKRELITQTSGFWPRRR